MSNPKNLPLAAWISLKNPHGDYFIQANLIEVALSMDFRILEEVLCKIKTSRNRQTYRTDKTDNQQEGGEGGGYASFCHIMLTHESPKIAKIDTYIDELW